VDIIKYSITNGHNSYMLWKLIGLCRKCEIKTSWNVEILYSQADFMVDKLTIYNTWNEFEKYLCGIAKEFRMFLKWVWVRGCVRACMCVCVIIDIDYVLYICILFTYSNLTTFIRYFFSSVPKNTTTIITGFVTKVTRWVSICK
jgi:hypothetical protein